MYSVEVTAKKAEDALKDALKQLSATIDEVEVKVLEAGGLFRHARLEVSLLPEVRERRERRNRKDRAREGFGVSGEKPRFEQPRFEQSGGANNGFAPRQKPEQRSDERTGKAEPKLKEQPARTPFGAAKPEQREKPRFENTRPQPKEQSGFKQPQQPSKEQPGRQQQNLKEQQKPVSPSVEKNPDAPSEVPEKALAETTAFLKNVMEKMGFSGEIKTHAHGLDVDITVLEEDPAIIGYRGETIDSLEYLAGLIANRDSEKYIKVSLDNNNYRDRRSDNLVKLAEKMAAKCIKTGHKVSLEPMNSANRKIVHAALSSNDKVTTRSEGKEPNRRVVIYFKRDKGGKPPEDKPKAPAPAPEQSAVLRPVKPAPAPEKVTQMPAFAAEKAEPAPEKSAPAAELAPEKVTQTPAPATEKAEPVHETPAQASETAQSAPEKTEE